MEIKLSGSIGFCYGVKNAVDLSNKALSRKKGKIFSVGPLIHNPQVVDELLKKGLMPVDKIDGIKSGTIIVSSHGAGARLLGDNNIKKGSLKVIDATCPFVKKIQEQVKRLYKDGYKVVIVGKETHPEVKALLGFTDKKGIVIKDRGEAESIDLKGLKVGVISQSTYSQKTFLEVVSLLLQKSFAELRVFDTICRDTVKRQDAIRQLAHSADTIIVVGGKNSSNTRRLIEVCKEEGRPARHIEESSQIDPSWFKNEMTVGIASGASTPDWVVQDVITKIRRYC